MITSALLEEWQQEIQGLKDAGLYKNEWPLESAQGAEITVNGKKMLNFCANNYLGLANHPEVIAAAKQGLDDYGFGTASVRFICGTQDIHKTLEKRIADFFETEDAILFSSCWHANGGLFSVFLGPEDAIVSANLNHASIIDGVRLCKAQRFFYEHDKMEDLEEKLKEARAAGCKKIMVATDGVFSMDGDIAPLDKICDIAEKYEAMVMVDDSHATGFVGATGRGSIELRDVMDRVDILSSTLGKAMGGSAGGFITGKKEIVEKLRNQARPYLFSNNVTPSVAVATLKIFDLLDGSKDLLKRIQDNTAYFRNEMVDAGFNIRLGKAGEHPICPVMLGDAKLATAIAKDMIEEEGIYVIGFCFPVVPKGEARIRVQISAAHTKEQLDRAIEAFKRVGKKHGVI